MMHFNLERPVLAVRRKLNSRPPARCCCRAFFLFILVFFGVASTLTAQEEFQHPVRVRGVSVNVELGGRIQVGKTFDRGQITVRLLLFPNTPHQTVQSQKAVIQGGGTRHAPEKVVNEDGNRFAIFHLNEPGQYEYALTASVQTDRHPANSTDESKTLTEEQQRSLTRGTKHVQVDDAGIQQQSRKLLTSDRFLNNLHNVTTWVHSAVEYDRQFYPQTLSAAEVFRKRRGVCDEFSALAGALFRSGGIPVRFVSGVVYSGSSWGNHAWMEAYQPGSGWTPVDPTYEEAIVLDGTHIRRGHFPDPEGGSMSVRVRTRSNTKPNIRVQKGEPEIEVRRFTAFKELMNVEARDVRFPSKRWVSLDVLVQNRTEKPIIVPILFRRIKAMEIKDRTTSRLLDGGASAPVRWSLKFNRTLSDRERINGRYELITMAEPVRREFTIFPDQLEEKTAGLVYDGGNPVSESGKTVASTEKTDTEATPLQKRERSGTDTERDQGKQPSETSETTFWDEILSDTDVFYALFGLLALIMAIAFFRRS